MTDDERRHAVLTPTDLETIRAIVKEITDCDKCSFSSEEVQFVKDWLDTAKTAKSEVIRWVVRSCIVLIGLIAGVQVAAKMGWFKQ